MDGSCHADGLCGVDRMEDAAKSLPVSRASSFLGADSPEFSLGMDLLCPAPIAHFIGGYFRAPRGSAAAHFYFSKNVDHCGLVNGAFSGLDHLSGVSKS